MEALHIDIEEEIEERIFSRMGTDRKGSMECLMKYRRADPV
jgi:hypothetical protein